MGGERFEPDLTFSRPTSNGHNNGDSEIETMMTQAMSAPIMRDLLTREATEIYQGSLRQLGCPEEDIERTVTGLSARPLEASSLQVLYQSRRGAQRHRAGSINGHRSNDIAPRVEETSGDI